VLAGRPSIGAGENQRGAQRRPAIAAWIAGLLAFAAVLGIVFRLSEIENILRLLRGMRPVWFVVALVLQGATYLCAAAVWQVALARAGHRTSTLSLVPVSLAMLFTNQTVPSGGLSGSALVLRALGVRGVHETAAMAALLVGLVTTYAAYLIAITASVLVLAVVHQLTGVLLVVFTLFGLACTAIPLAILWYSRSAASSRLRDRLAGVPVFGPALTALASAPTAVLRDPRVLRRTIALQFLELVLDAATLFVCLVALGVLASPLAVFASFVMAYAAAHVAPTPLGLGTFEGASIAMLHLVGVQIEAALAATLLFRGFTLWLPMLPGFWCARRVLAERSS
jgi:uncharacterized protein (TIRG00374 family)